MNENDRVLPLFDGSHQSIGAFDLWQVKPAMGHLRHAIAFSVTPSISIKGRLFKDLLIVL
jgi:hypothetical protein